MTDLKPSNLFLLEGRLDRVRIIDFGIAREMRREPNLSRSGDILGTPGYMAPEQVRGETVVGPCADVFSLGCILYQCLAGQPPFAGERPVEVLGKILFSEPPRVAEHRPEVPAALAELLSRMLAKEPAKRPRDAVALRGALVALLPVLTADSSAALTNEAPEIGLTSNELRLFSIVVATFPSEQNTTGSEQLHATLTSRGAKVEYLEAGGLLVTVARVSSAQDQVAVAARCALLVQQRYPEAQTAVATGRGLLSQGKDAQVGEVFERAAQMAVKPGDASVPGRIWLDELTAGLLGPGFAQTRTPAGNFLVGETANGDEVRWLLGRPAPFVGREPDLLMLETLLRHSAGEPCAQGVLVVASPGVGKSRLRHEFLMRIRTWGTKLLILQKRANPIGAGSPYSILAQAMRAWCGAQRGEDLAEQQSKLKRRTAECIPTAELARVSGFLGELCDIPFPDDHSVLLLAARCDAKLMHDQIRQAFVDCVRAECARCPLLLILDDLHWGDVLSVKLIDAVLRELPEQPLMVLALARPEVKDRFPSLWAGRIQEIPLRGLGKRAAERLCYQVLGPHTQPPLVARIVERAAGNALCLEELMRAVAEGDDTGLPGTVLAVLQARILRLDVTARQALRAASVLGETFWQGSLLALLGIAAASTHCDDLLHRLVAAEVIEQRPESRFAGEIEFRFRHGLMRDAAYSLLTAEDMQIGHRLAARYLEKIGETEAVVIAEHYYQGALLTQAVPFFTRAAEQSMDRYDAEGVLARVERGIACGAKEQQLGALRSLELQALGWIGRWQSVPSASREAIRLLRPGSKQWCRTLSSSGYLAATGELGQLVQLSRQIVETEPADDAITDYISAIARFVLFLSTYGVRADAQLCLERLLTIAVPHRDGNQVARSWCSQAHSYYLRFLGADPWSVYTLNQESLAAYEQMGDLRGLVFKIGELGSSVMELGSWSDAEPLLRRALLLAQKLPEPYHAVYASGALMMNLVRSGDPQNRAEAHNLATALIPAVSGNSLLEGTTRTFWGQNYLASGQLHEAECELRQAIDLLQSAPAQQILSIAYLLPVLLKKDQLAASHTLAGQGLHMLEQLGDSGENLCRFLVASAEVHSAVGQVELAAKILDRACHQIEIRAQRIPDPAWRIRFLDLPENRRADELQRFYQAAERPA